MIISDTAIRQRISVMVLSLIIIVWGLYSYFSLPRESSPDITIPNVFVSTSYRGVSPADIEKSITIPIEKKLKGLENVKKIQSVSSEGLSSINIEFITGTDIDEVLQKVRDKVDEAHSELPSDLEEDPSVFEVNFSELPIQVLSLSGDIGLARLKKIADDLQDDIEAIPGVLECEVSGGLEREIRIEPYAKRLAYYGIPFTSLQEVISGENQNVSGGIIQMGDGRFRLRVPGEFSLPEEILGLVVGTHMGEPVYLKDVAMVIDGFKEQDSRSRLNGREAINLSIKKRTGENIIAITDEIEALILKSSHTWPKGVEITKLMDQAKDIREMIADLENNLLSGLILVVLVLLFSLGLRNALLVSLAIPMSMLMSFSILQALGITLNMVVLFSLTLALGMLVDNAIVIIENIYRYMEQGVPRYQAAMKATSEVAYPIIGSTMTTVFAFFPLIFCPGIMGEFMRYLPITLIITLSSSLFVALVINPALASFFMKEKRLAGNGAAVTAEEIQKAGEQPVACNSPILKWYRSILGYCLNHRVAVTIASFVFLALCVQVWLLRVGLEKPVEFFPHIDPLAFYINMDMPEGADLDYCDRIAKQAEIRACGGDLTEYNNGKKDLDTIYYESMTPRTHKKRDGSEFEGPGDLSNIEYIYSRTITRTDGGLIFSSNTPNHVGIQFIDLEDRIQPSPETLEEIRQRVKGIPGAKITILEREEGPPTGAPINIEIVGEDFRILGRIAYKIRDIISQVPFVEDVRDDYIPGHPSIQVRVDRQKAALLGLSTNTIGFVLKTAFNGLQISTYHEADEDYDITIQLSQEERESTDILRHLLIPSPSGQLVPLSTIAKFSYTGSLGEITRINHERVVTVKANVNEEYVPGPVAREQAEELLSGLTLPPGYKIRFTGEFEFQQEAEDFLSKAFLVALFLIFLILVTQFNSINKPFIIMTTVLLSLGGVFLGLTCCNFSFGIIMTGVGVISLAGVVVNNGILLIDYINQLKQRDFTSQEAIIAGGCTRLRPVFLTAITTILGLVPMVTGISYDFHKGQIAWISQSSQWWRTMASAVIFGLTLATILTLIIVPVFYSMTESIQAGFLKGLEWCKEVYWKPYHRLIEKKKG
ncbi:MAG: efflux RND transporter permease subunit [bacterium]